MTVTSPEHAVLKSQMRKERRRLIVKAARRYHYARAASLRQVNRRDDDLDLLGEVAADVLGMCYTSSAFFMAVREALAEHPHPSVAGRKPPAAAAARLQWEDEIESAVLERLAD